MGSSTTPPNTRPTTAAPLDWRSFWSRARGCHYTPWIASRPFHLKMPAQRSRWRLQLHPAAQRAPRTRKRLLSSHLVLGKTNYPRSFVPHPPSAPLFQGCVCAVLLCCHLLVLALPARQGRGFSRPVALHLRAAQHPALRLAPAARNVASALVVRAPPPPLRLRRPALDRRVLRGPV